MNWTPTRDRKGWEAGEYRVRPHPTGSWIAAKQPLVKTWMAGLISRRVLGGFKTVESAMRACEEDIEA